MSDDGESDKGEPESRSSGGFVAHLAAEGVTYLGRFLLIIGVGLAIRLAGDAIVPFAGEDTALSFDLTVAVVITASVVIPALWGSVKVLMRINTDLRAKLRNYRDEIWHLEREAEQVKRELQECKDERDLDESNTDGNDGHEGEES